MSRGARERIVTGAAQRPRGDVRAVDGPGARIALVTDWGYTIARVLQGNLRLRDVVEGDLDRLGQATWRNLGTGLPVQVDITHVQATMLAAQRILLGPAR